MSKPIFPESTPDIAHKRRQLAPKTLDAFKAFSAQVFAEGAISAVPRPGVHFIGMGPSAQHFELMRREMDSPDLTETFNLADENVAGIVITQKACSKTPISGQLGRIELINIRLV